MRGLLTESLSSLGYTCLSARDGREALQVLAQVGQVDAIHHGFGNARDEWL